MHLETSCDSGNRDLPCCDDGFSGLVQLFERNHQKLLRVAQRITGSREEAEDIVQDSALKALLKLPHFRGDSRLGTWFYSIVVNTSIDHRRRYGRHRNESLDNDIEDGEQFACGDTGIPYLDSEQSYAREELRWMVLSEIAQLKLIHRGVIQLCYIEGYSYIEAAEVLHVGVATAKARLYRGRKELRSRLYERMSALRPSTTPTLFHQ